MVYTEQEVGGDIAAKEEDTLLDEATYMHGYQR
jgi:hypothetical protein